jgi:hypothetical protein
LRETGEAMSSQELAACILQRFGKPLEARSLTLAVAMRFTRISVAGRMGFWSSTGLSYPGKWRLIMPIGQQLVWELVR